MSSAVFWFNNIDNSTNRESSTSTYRIERRHIRDRSNPLDLPPNTFVQYFRVNKELFMHLLDIIDTNMGPTIGSCSVPPIIKLTACIRFFGEGSYQKGVGNDLFAGIAQPTMSRILAEVLDILEMKVCPLEIKFPAEEAEKLRIKRGFFEKTGFPGVIGCVDGTHVKIIKPKAEVQHSYYNRKGFHSLNVMLLCDHQQMIRYVDASRSGSTHDSLVWNLSGLSTAMEINYRRGERNTWIVDALSNRPLASEFICEDKFELIRRILVTFINVIFLAWDLRKCTGQMRTRAGNMETLEPSTTVTYLQPANVGRLGLVYESSEEVIPAAMNDKYVYITKHQGVGPCSTLSRLPGNPGSGPSGLFQALSC
ncbi:putative nuclease HARBI1 [Sabethes cyaneus]|uniref:putative nuclease HARBI1 n=1 Tax=Sabethes cyaneus TaxID=53552 RepID=UPI00237E7FEF|nr:putative nuclease HARBI1 [Sabethes cyaneus]